ncbi:MAG TPA: hypothetical protein VGQ79_08365, partial [Nitrospiraceae bacterium]|nr:hypothetical protein [Nitrospiraceae bacterium]
MEKKWAHIRSQGMKCGLKDLVRKAIANLHPTLARDHIRMIRIPHHTDRIVVLAITINYHS